MFNLGEFSMKKTLVALAALASMSAFAQSSVTLYGIADVWVGSLKTNSVTVTGAPATGFVANQVALSQTKLDSAGQSGARWGLRGSEDLGGGLKANFVFESGLNVDTGSAAQGGLAFGRQAFVGLSGGFGEVRFGRQYSAYDVFKGGISAQGNNSFDVTNGAALAAVDVDALNGVFASSANTAALQQAAVKTAADKLVGKLGAWVGYNARIDNALSYTTPNFGGITGQVVLGLGENKTATAGATLNSSFHVNYANGPLAVGVAYQNDQLRKVAAGTTALQNTIIGGSYDLGVAKLFASYNRAQYKVPGGSDKANEFNIGARAPFGPVTLVGQYAQSKFKDADDKSTGFSLEALYALSKRTDTYVGFTNTKIDDDTKNRLFAVGIRHRF
jgi:predicted porin